MKHQQFLEIATATAMIGVVMFAAACPSLAQSVDLGGIMSSDPTTGWTTFVKIMLGVLLGAALLVAAIEAVQHIRSPGMLVMTLIGLMFAGMIIGFGVFFLGKLGGGNLTFTMGTPHALAGIA